MEVKFISDYGVLDLAGIKISVQESNAKVSDTLFTKFTFPFDVYADQEFLDNYGDYTSFESSELLNRIPGQMVFENKLYEAVLFIKNVLGRRITAQIDFGFEDVPNFDKKLSELPLEQFDVTDIHTFAKTVAAKKYPETNFNFPRIFTKKYPTTDEVWKNFDGYINDLKKDGTEMRRNYIDGVGDIYNVNIIHPCPYILYLLKAGFAEAGYMLAGDILTDANLLQKTVYSGTEYFSRLTQNRQGLRVMSSDYVAQQGWLVRFEKTLTIEKKGKYRIIGYFRSQKSIWGTGLGVINLNGSRIYTFNKPDKVDKVDHFNLEININQDNSTLFFGLLDPKNLSMTEPVMSVDVINLNLANEAQYTGTDLGVITNRNEVNLKLAVPDITFGDLVRIVKNWFNYDVEIREKTVYMNLIAKEGNANVKDFTFMEVPQNMVSRELLNKKSFLLKFPDMDGGIKKDSMYYDIDGPKLNGTAKTDTTTININGYLMPLTLPKPGGYNTATVLKESSDILALVEYAGLLNGQNNATYSPGCDFPELFDSNWLTWLQQRIKGHEFSWRKTASVERLCQYSVKDLIFCYNNIHIIKTINKYRVSDDYYDVEITTETIV